MKGISFKDALGFILFGGYAWLKVRLEILAGKFPPAVSNEAGGYEHILTWVFGVTYLVGGFVFLVLGLDRVLRSVRDKDQRLADLQSLRDFSPATAALLFLVGMLLTVVALRDLLRGGPGSPGESVAGVVMGIGLMIAGYAAISRRADDWRVRRRRRVRNLHN